MNRTNNINVINNIVDEEEIRSPAEIYGYQCSPTCPYFPDMTNDADKWYIDDVGIKRRKRPKVFRCLYDNHPIDWFVPCPKLLQIDPLAYKD